MTTSQMSPKHMTTSQMKKVLRDKGIEIPEDAGRKEIQRLLDDNM